MSTSQTTTHHHRRHDHLLLLRLLMILSVFLVRHVSEASTRPNILLIMTDQQRFDAIRRVQDELTRYDNTTKIRTPNLDRLSRRGAYFRNAYCQCSVCAPARTSLRTGCTVERTGIQTNDLAKYYSETPLFNDRVQKLEGIDEILARLGYVNEYYGKWHIPDKLAHSTRSGERIIQNNDYNYQNDQFMFRDGSWGGKFRRYLRHFEQEEGGITKEYMSGTQEDTYSKYPYTPLSRIDVRYGYPTRTPLTIQAGFEPQEISQPNVCGAYSLSENYTASYFNGDIAVKALRRLLANSDEQSFFLTVSFHHPHPPMVTARSYLDYYWENRHGIYVPPSIDDTLENSAYKTWSNKMPAYGDPTTVKEWTALYFSLVEEIDDWVGQLLNELDSHDDDEYNASNNNTIIIFTSDHGEMLGAHGMREKNKFLEESAKVPLFIAFDGVIEPETIVDEPVSHLDIVATILDYIDASSEDTSDGKSLRPLIENREYNSEGYETNYVVAEWDYRMSHGDRRIDERPALMVRHGPYKLMMQKLASTNRIDMLYDLRNDPYEMNNLLGSNAAQATDVTLGKAEHLRCLLLEWMERLDGGDEGYYSDPIANFGQGQGDIAELQQRQSWPALDFWVGDESIEMDRLGSVDGIWLIRSEYLHIGSRVGDDDVVITIAIAGPHAPYFRLNQDRMTIEPRKCQSVQITFQVMEAFFMVLGETQFEEYQVMGNTQFEASIVISREGKSDDVIVVPVSAPIKTAN